HSKKVELDGICYETSDICISELSHLEFSAFLSTDGAATIAIAKNGTNFTGLMQLNNDYSLLFYHDGKINMEGLIKQMEL
ncbi:hypothetical protein OFN56_40480, partial [Escherichia coli]|nr:hypothetical protein [Escherichia coli]